MRKNAFYLLMPIFMLAIGLAVPRAQTNVPTDSLGGKTVHVYLPSLAIDTLVIQNLNIRMKEDAQFWYSYTFTKAGLYDYQDGFYFTDPSHRQFFSKSGLGTTEAPRFMLADFAGGKEIWIIVDPTGPATAKPVIMLQPPKTVNILNPWSTTAPKLVSGAKTRNMTTVSGHCGWFSAMLLDTTMTKGHFAEISDAATYGKSGFSGTDDFDFAALFTQFGPTIWLNTEANSWTGTYPNVDGTCQYMMAMTIRDFSKDHPDFEFGSLTGDHVVKGVVQSAIGPDPDRKPVLNTAGATKDPAITFGTFDTWWRTDSTNATPTMRSYESCYDLPMSKSSDGLWEYDSFRDSPDHGFWPVEGTLNRFPTETMTSCYVKPPPDSTTWVTSGQPKRNGNFCAESHATFIYSPGQKFAFRGDDDVWVYIDGKLVVDLGGVHTPKSDSVDLSKLNLTAGKTYKWDFFYCDRQPCGSSLRIKTSIFFLQQRSLYGEQEPGPTPGSIILKIWKRQGGTGSCGSVGADTTSKPASNLTYQVVDAAGKVVKDLTNPGSFYGGISIAEPQISVDTSKLVPGTDLVPGATYRIVAFEPANQKVRVEVPFKVPVRNYVDYDSPATATALAGQLIPVIVSNRDQAGAKAAGALNYAPIIPAGLLVYTNAAGTAAAPATLTTNADGFDTLWVTANPTADKSYTLSLSAPAKLNPVLTFTVPTDRVEFVAPLSSDTLVGKIVAINLQAVDKTGPQAKAITYTLKIPAGLKVFSDAAGTTPITGGTTGADGTGIIYATSENPVDATYILEINGSIPTRTLKFHMPTDRVEFVPPLARDTLVGSIVTIDLQTMDKGVAQAKPLAYTLKIPAGLKVYSDAAGTLPITGGTTGADGKGRIYATADSTDPVDKTYILEIIASVPTMTLKFRMPPLDLPKAVSAGIYDDNGDGIGDRIEVTYDRDITAVPPKSAAYKWPSTATAVAVAGADVAKGVAGKVLTLKGTFSQAILTAGTGVFSSTYQARKVDSTQNLNLDDHIGPVIKTAVISLGAAMDTLRIKFSEPIGSGPTGPASDWFGIKRANDGDVEHIAPVSTKWKDDRSEVTLIYDNSKPESPRAGNLVRIEDSKAGIVDERGNTSGPQPRFRVITGDNRAQIKTVTLKELDPVGLPGKAVETSSQPNTAKVETVVETTKRLGHLLKVDLGSFAVGDDFNPVPLSQVVLEWQVHYFTNHGEPVNDAKGAVACDDKDMYGGDCTSNRRFVFVGWNGATKAGNKVGTGAYVARFSYVIKVAGKVMDRGGLDQIWGITRKR